jgi:hypothetical protein
LSALVYLRSGINYDKDEVTRIKNHIKRAAKEQGVEIDD